MRGSLLKLPMKTLRLLITVCLLVIGGSVAMPGSARAEVVCSKVSSEFDFNWSGTSGMRAKLSNTNYFGPGAAVAPESLTFSTLAAVNATTLAGCNIFIGGGFQENLSAAEGAALVTWANLGGDRFVIGGCDSGSNQTCNAFGRTLTQFGSGLGVSLVGGLAYNPLTCGGANSVQTFGGQAARIGTFAGDSVYATHNGGFPGSPAATTDDAVNPTFLFTADADMFGSSGNATITNNPVADNNQAVFILNAFKFALDGMKGRLANPQCYDDYNSVTDLALSIGATSTAVGVGVATTVTLTVDNQSLVDADDVVVTAAIPAGFSYSSQSGDGSYDDSTGVWTIGAMPNGGTKSIQITMTANAVGTPTMQAEITGLNLPDDDSAPNASFAEDDLNDGVADDDEVSLGFTVTTFTPSGPALCAIPTNLIQNGAFDDGLNGFPATGGWETFGSHPSVQNPTAAPTGAAADGYPVESLNTAVRNQNDNANDILTVTPVIVPTSTLFSQQLHIWFDAGWRHAGGGGSKASTLRVNVDGTDYYQITTVAGEGAGSATGTTLNGAGIGQDSASSWANPGGGGAYSEWNTVHLVIPYTGTAPDIDFVMNGQGHASDDFVIDRVYVPMCFPDYGDAPDTYGTDYIAGNAGSEPIGPSHAIDSAIYMGAGEPDPEFGGQPSPNGDGDDTNRASNDEDGVTIPTLTQGANATITASVTGAGGYLQGWIDWDGSGTFDAGEQVATDLQDDGTGDDATAGDGTLTFSVTPPVDAVTTQTFARFRWSTTSGLDSTTAAPDGEVEDYALTILPGFDFSDAPLSYGGASHGLVTGPIRIGATNTNEAADYDDPNAAGDAGDDGVTIPALVPGTSGTITVAVGGTGGFLQGWIDWDGSGAFDDPVEQIATDLQDTDADGTISIPVTVPTYAVTSQTFARFRWSTDFGIGFDGAAPDGEVEDYALTLGATGSVLAGHVFIDNGAGGATAHDAAKAATETATSNATVSLYDGGGTLIATPAVQGDGSWSYILPVSYSGAVTVTATPVPGWLTISEQTAGLPILVNPDSHDGSYTFTPVSGASYTVLDIGLIEAPRLIQDQVAGISGGQVILLAHTYTATSNAAVTFGYADQVMNPAGAFSATLFEDTDCDGTPDAIVATPRAVAANDSVCLISRVTASAGIGDGATFSYTLSATSAFSGTTKSDVARNTDAVRSGSDDQLALQKTVRNVTQGGAEGASNQGDIGDVLEYRIIMTNPSGEPAINITVNDRTPAYTALSAPIPSPVTVAGGVTCSVTTPAANVAGYAGPVEWSCPGTFPAGAQGAVTFRVLITP